MTYCSILTVITIKELTVTVLTGRNNHSVTIGAVEGIDRKILTNRNNYGATIRTLEGIDSNNAHR